MSNYKSVEINKNNKVYTNPEEPGLLAVGFFLEMRQDISHYKRLGRDVIGRIALLCWCSRLNTRLTLIENTSRQSRAAKWHTSKTHEENIVLFLLLPSSLPGWGASPLQMNPGNFFRLSQQFAHNFLTRVKRRGVRV